MKKTLITILCAATVGFGALVCKPDVPQIDANVPQIEQNVNQYGQDVSDNVAQNEAGRPEYILHKTSLPAGDVEWMIHRDVYDAVVRYADRLSVFDRLDFFSLLDSDYDARLCPEEASDEKLSEAYGICGQE